MKRNHYPEYNFIKTFFVALTRFLSTTSPDIATYEEVKKVPNNPKTILIDVREPQELVDTGIVPASINIPLGKVQEYLSGLSDSDFAKMFNRSKPTTDNELIFMCKIGKNLIFLKKISSIFHT